MVQSSVVLELNTDLWKRAASLFCVDRTYLKRYNLQSLPQIQALESQFKILGIENFLVWNPSFELTNQILLYDHRCPACWTDELKIVNRESVVVCTRCGYIIRDSIIDQVPRSVSSRPRASTRSYAEDIVKRRNHFKYWLRRIQGKESHPLTPENMTEIKAYIEQQYDPSFHWDYNSMKACLRRMNHPEWYDHTYFILKMVCNKPFVDLTSYHEAILMEMFFVIQKPFAKHRTDRINMLNYAYILRKFTEIQGWVGLSEQIPYLKSHVKLFALDKIWRKICKDVGYQFIPSTV